MSKLSKKKKKKSFSASCWKKLCFSA